MVDLAQGAFYGVLKIRTFEGAMLVDDMRVSIREPGQTQFDPRDTTPSDQVLKEGKYTVRIEKKGFETIDRDVDIVHGELTNLRIDVARSDVSESWVYVQGADRAKVVVDDREVGIWMPGNPVRIETKAGKHKLVVRADDRKTFEYEVEFPRGRATSMHVDMKPGVSRTAAWVNGILAVGFLGGGSVWALNPINFRPAIAERKERGHVEPGRPTHSRGPIFAIFADVSFGLAAVLGVISFYQFLADPTPPSTATMSKPTDIDEAGKPVASLNPSANQPVGRPKSRRTFTLDSVLTTEVSCFDDYFFRRWLWLPARGMTFTDFKSNTPVFAATNGAFGARVASGPDNRGMGILATGGDGGDGASFFNVGDGSTDPANNPLPGTQICTGDQTSFSEGWGCIAATTLSYGGSMVSPTDGTTYQGCFSIGYGIPDNQHTVPGPVVSCAEGQNILCSAPKRCLARSRRSAWQFAASRGIASYRAGNDVDSRNGYQPAVGHWQ